MLNARQRQFLQGQRIGRLATADARGAPHVVPVCFAVAGMSVYITVDEKPKQRTGRPLKRLRNIGQNPVVALVVDHYDEDWSRLAWVMLRGRAEVVTQGPEHAEAQAMLRDRYPQYREMKLHDLPVIAIRIERVNEWGDLPTPDSK